MFTFASLSMRAVRRDALTGLPVRSATAVSVARKPLSASAAVNADQVPDVNGQSSNKITAFKDLPFGKINDFAALVKICSGKMDFNVALAQYHEEHGDTFKSTSFGMPTVTTRDPNFIKALVSPHEGNADRVDLAASMPGLSIVGDIFGKTNPRNRDLTFFSIAVGEKNWAIPRKIAEKGLQKMSFVKKSNETAHVVAEKLMERWHKKCAASGAGVVRCDTVEEDIQRFALDIIGFLAFDKDFGRLAEDDADSKDLGRTIIENYKVIMDNFFKPKFFMSPVRWWDHLGQFSKDFRDVERATLTLGHVVTKLIDERVEERKANGGAADNKCYLDMLLDMWDPEKMTPEWAMVQGITIIIAGADTTTNTSTFMAHELARNPEWQRRVYEAVKPVFEANPRPSYSDLAEIPELNAFIKETQRMYPITPQLSREIPEGFTYDGITYGKTACMLSYTGLHHHPEHWEQPHKFNPQRFMDKQRGADNAWAFQPFGAGKRGCPGMRVALMDLRVILAQMVYNFEFRVADGYVGGMKDVNSLNKLRPNLEVIMESRAKTGTPSPPSGGPKEERASSSMASTSPASGGCPFG